MPDRFLKYYTRLLHETEPYSTSTPSASVQVTTETPGQVFSFALLEANQPTTVDWGDGSSSEVPLSAGSAEVGLQTNTAPSGTHQAACPPTTGKEFAYQLVNDTCSVVTNPYTSVQFDA